MSAVLIRRLLAPALITASLLLAAACGEEAAPAPALTPTPAATPTPTPAPTPTSRVEDLLEAVSSSIAKMSSAKFSMVDETETGALFFGTTFKRMEAEVEDLGSVKMQVEVETPNFGFVQIGIIKVGDQAFLRFSDDAPWTPLPPDQVPFEFSGLAVVFSNLPGTVQHAAITGQETVKGARTVVIEVVVDSEALLPLITTADPGHEMTVTLWIDEAGFVLRQLRLVGQIYDDDGPETSRLLTIEDINVPVDIDLPDIVSGQ